MFENRKILFPIDDNDILYIMKEYNNEWYRRKAQKKHSFSSPIPGNINIKHSISDYEPVIFSDSPLPPESHKVLSLRKKIEELELKLSEKNIRLMDLQTEVDRYTSKLAYITREMEYFINYIKKM